MAPPAEGFRRLRDARSDARFERDVFAPLEHAGVPRARLQLAWDFTTGSVAHPRRDLLRVRELTRAWLDANLAKTAVRVIARRSDDRGDLLTLGISVPSFLDETGGSRARLARGPEPAREVEQRGEVEVELLVVIPRARLTGSTPGRPLAYGHGFFGGKDELEGTAARTIAERVGAVLFGLDWRGMSKVDLVALADTFAERPERATDFAERVHQAMASWLVASALVRGRLVGMPELRRADGGPLYDPSFLGYFGASQGHILGGTFAALDEAVDRAVLNVGGGGFVHIMPRSGAFGTFALLLRSAFADSLTRLLFTSMMQSSLDRIDPVTYAPLLGDRALLQLGLGDNAVPTSAGLLHARALGAKLVVPSPREVSGLETTPGGTPGASVTLFDYGYEVPMDEPRPQSPSPMHDGLRSNQAALAQMEAFLKPGGVAIHPCEGPCDPM